MQRRSSTIEGVCTTRNLYPLSCSHFKLDSVKAIPGATQFFALVESLCVFLATTKVHVIFLQKQKELHPDKPTRELQRLSDTRWACRYSSINAMCYTFDAILATLEDMGEDSDGMKAT